MPLARHPHVIHAMQCVFYWLARQLRGNRTDTGPGVRLILFSTKTASETLNVYLDLVHRKACYPTNRTLYGRWPLGRRVNTNASVLGRQGVRTLRLDIKMLLAILIGAPLKDMLAILKGACRIAQNKLLRRDDKAFIGRCHARVGDGFKLVDLGGDEFRTFPRVLFRVRDDDPDRHSLEMNFI